MSLKLSHALKKHKELLMRSFHSLPRRAVMEKCALNATETPDVNRVFSKVMVQTPKMSPILHRTGSGNLIEGSGPPLVVKEAQSGILTAEGNSATAAEVRGWMAEMTPRDKRELSNGIDVVFLNQLLEAVEKLKTDPRIADVCKQMADECHKPAPSIDVEMGEFLYGLSDSFNIIKEAHEKGMHAHDANLPTKSGRKAKYVVGGHPSNFVVYVSPVLEAIALGWPSVILNHPQVPTAASKFINLLELNGVDFKGKLVQAVTSNVDDLCGVFKGDVDEITQGILIAGLSMGKTIAKTAPNTKQELSGSNELVCTADQYKADTAGFIDSLKLNLGYSGGKQCTAPSKMIFVGFKEREVSDVQKTLQSWSDSSEYKAARDLTDFTSHVPYLFNDDPGNEQQFINAPDKFSPFVNGPRAVYRQDDENAAVQEVFGPATAFQFVDTLENVKLSSHSLSIGINVDIRESRESLLDFLKVKDLKYLPAIINIGYNASTLAATPTGEAFIPWHYTLSGQDTGMGPHSPLRYSSFQLSDEAIAANVAQCKGLYYHNVCEDASVAMHAHSDLFGPIDKKREKDILLSNAMESDKALQPTLNARLLDGDDIKLTLYMPVRIDEPTFIRLTEEDTPDIRRNFISYALQLHRNGVPIRISASPDLVNVDSILSGFQACVRSAVEGDITVAKTSDGDFIASLEGKPQTVLISDEDYKIRLKEENHFLTVFPSTQLTPWAVVGVKPQTVKVSGNMTDCIETLVGFIKARVDQSPVNVTFQHVNGQVKAAREQVYKLRRDSIIASYEKYATPHYKGKVPVVANKTEGIRTTEEDGGFYLDCNLAYGAAKAGFTPDVSGYTLLERDIDSLSVLPSQAMYTKYLSDSLRVLSTRYGPLINNTDAHPIQVCLLNSGGEIIDSIQQAVRRHFGDERAVVVYPRGNFNGRREHANKLNQEGPLPLAFDEHGELVVDNLRRCFTAFNDTDELERIVNACEASGRKAAIIWEPIQGEGGVNVTSPEFVSKLNQLQAEEKLIIVADEVQTGFAGSRSHVGSMSSHLGVKPDIIALAKSLTLGKVAASCAVLTSKLAATAFPAGVDGGTFSGSPAACHSIIAADKFWHESDSLDRLYDVGNSRIEKMQEALAEFPNPHCLSVKGIGSMGAVEFASTHAGAHYHDFFVEMGERIKGDVDAPNVPKGFRGIIQKMSGKSGETMRMTSGLSDSEADQKLLTKLLIYGLTSPKYYPPKN